MAHDLMHDTAIKHNTDICIISEPNVILTQRMGWHADDSFDTALICRNPEIKITSSGKGNGFTWINTSLLVIISCYISPNCELSEFAQYITEIDNFIKHLRKPILIAGDFNAKSLQWGEKDNDRRGDMLTDWIASRDLSVANQGRTPSLQRKNGCSWPDITICTAELANKIHNWAVMEEEESGSDHLYIKFEINLENTILIQEPRAGWYIKENKILSFVEEIKKLTEECDDDQLKLPCTIEKILVKACDHIFAKKSTTFRKNRKPAYWWNDEIASARVDCLKARRLRTKTNKTINTSEEIKAHNDLQYKNKKKKLKNLILEAKKENWKKMLLELDNDIWGLGYRLIVKRVAYRRPQIKLSVNEMEEAKKLFPQHKLNIWTKEPVVKDVTPFSKEELQYALNKLKTKKAPGPDLIAPEIIKIFGSNFEDLILGLVNYQLLECEFPCRWKTAQLVLIEKEAKENQPTRSFRPICLLNSMGKLYEQMILQRLMSEIEKGEGLSEMQFGFRPKLSTLNALSEIMQQKQIAAQGKWPNRSLCLLVTLDIRNAFNSTPWNGIISELTRRKISTYLINLIKSYLSDRTIQVNKEETLEMSCGVPQGSILGPTLWNLYYDGIFNLTMPEGVTIIGYADDIAVTIIDKSPEKLLTKTNYSIDKISKWIKKKGLSLAPEKTEALILEGRINFRDITINIEGHKVQSQDQIKYLGVMLGRNGKWNKHVEYTCRKAESKVKLLAKLMPNVGGPKSSKRRISCSAIHSVILYAAPIWADVINKSYLIKKLTKIQRKLALRIASGYRTVSTEAISVIAEIPPIDLLIKERTKLYKDNSISRGQARADLLDEWQEKWNINTGQAK